MAETEAADGNDAAPDWNADAGADKKTDEADIEQKRRVANAKKKKKTDYVDLIGKIVLFPIVLVRLSYSPYCNLNTASCSSKF